MDCVLLVWSWLARMHHKTWQILHIQQDSWTDSFSVWWFRSAARSTHCKRRRAEIAQMSPVSTSSIYFTASLCPLVVIRLFYTYPNRRRIGMRCKRVPMHRPPRCHAESKLWRLWQELVVKPSRSPHNGKSLQLRSFVHSCTRLSFQQTQSTSWFVVHPWSAWALPLAVVTLLK